MNLLLNCCWPLFLSLLMLWGAGAPNVCVGNESAVGLLVLRNGNILSGKVTRLEDHFRIDVEHGQLQVRINQAEMFCRTFDEAYQRRREMRTGSTADSHLELAKWCLRHKLLEYASREVQEARNIDPHHRKLKLLERQLKQAIAQQEKVPKLPLPEKEIVAEKNTDFVMTKQVPQWARVLFVKKVQPMLVKSCASTGCHQTGSTNQLQLNRLAVVGAGHPNATKGNLVSVLKQVDFQNAPASALVQQASTSHGAGASKPLSDRQLQILWAWVEQLVLTEVAADLPSKVKQATYTTREKSSVARLGEAYQQARDIADLRSKTQQAGQKTIDPFDPGVFNRRFSSHSGEKVKTTSAASSKNLPSSGSLPEP